MNLDQLRSFVEVAQTGHFTRAAEQLHLAQPSLSRQISTLERELGVELFHRVRGNVALTSAGERLLPLARRMLADADTARNEMAELAGLRRGRIRLGATPTLCTSLVAEVIAEFHERYPGVDIEILERGSRTLLSALMEGALDLALIVTSVSSGEARAVLDREPILSERLVVVSAASRPDPFGTASADHGRGLELSELAAVPQIAFPGELRPARRDGCRVRCGGAHTCCGCGRGGDGRCAALRRARDRCCRGARDGGGGSPGAARDAARRERAHPYRELGTSVRYGPHTRECGVAGPRT